VCHRSRDSQQNLGSRVDGPNEIYLLFTHRTTQQKSHLLYRFKNDHLKGYKSVQHVHEHLAQIRVRKGNSRNKTASPLQELFRHIGTYISKCRQFFIT